MTKLQSRQSVRGTISAAEIIAAYQEAFNIPWWTLALSTLATALGIGGIFRLADEYYAEMDEEAFEQFLENDKTDLEQYKHLEFDCDDFEFRLHGAVHMDRYLAAMPIFITWVSWEIVSSPVKGFWGRVWQRFKHFVAGQRAGHAVKSYYCKGEVKIVEPQNDDIYAVPGSWRLDLLCG